MGAEQLPIDFYQHDLTLKFAHAIVKGSKHTYEAHAHNDKWMQTECYFCGGQQSWSPPFKIPHKHGCVVQEAIDYIKEHD
jgi:hypothetical protein